MEEEIIGNRFDIVSLGRVAADGVMESCAVKTCVCTNPIHKSRMTKEEAALRGIEGKWEQDSEGGFVREITRVKIMPSEIVVKVPRGGKKPEVIREKIMIARCLDCGWADEIFIGGREARLVQLSYALN